MSEEEKLYLMSSKKQKEKMVTAGKIKLAEF